MMRKTIFITDSEKKAFEDIFINSIDTYTLIHVSMDWNNGTIKFDNECADYGNISNQHIYFEDFDVETVTPKEMLDDFIDNFNSFSDEISEDGNEYRIEIK